MTPHTGGGSSEEGHLQPPGPTGAVGHALGLNPSFPGQARPFSGTPGYFPQQGMAAPPARGYTPPTMPPIYSQQQPPAYDPFVQRNPLEFAAANGNLAVKEVRG